MGGFHVHLHSVCSFISCKARLDAERNDVSEADGSRKFLRDIGNFFK
jgi:hypothetical protein